MGNKNVDMLDMPRARVIFDYCVFAVVLLWMFIVCVVV
jgi:hypothetical protein